MCTLASTCYIRNIFCNSFHILLRSLRCDNHVNEFEFSYCFRVQYWKLDLVVKRCGWGKQVPYLEGALKVTLMLMQMGFCKFLLLAFCCVLHFTVDWSKWFKHYKHFRQDYRYLCFELGIAVFPLCC